MKKASHLSVDLVKKNPLIYNTLYFDQYSHLAVRLNIFRFSADKSETNLKFEKKKFRLISRARIETNPLMYNIEDLG